MTRNYSNSGQTLVLVLVGFTILLTLLTFLTKQISATYGLNHSRKLKHERNQILDVVDKTIDCAKTLENTTPDIKNLPEAALPNHCTEDLSTLKNPIFPLLDSDENYITDDWDNSLKQGRFGQWYFRGGCFLNSENKPCVVVHHAIRLNPSVASFRKDPLTKQDLDWQPFSNAPVCCL